MGMDLRKAKIQVHAQEPYAIACLFNPSEYSIKDSAKYASRYELGKDQAGQQYIHGENSELSLALYFDTTGHDYGNMDHVTEQEADCPAVSGYTEELVKLVRVAGELHRPPMVSFIWGNLCFKGIVTSVAQQFTYFSIEGKPLRAKVDLTIASAGELDWSYVAPPESPDRTKYRTLVEGMSLWKLAWEEYGDAARWKEIARANGITHPLDIRPGQVLKLPALPGR